MSADLVAQAYEELELAEEKSSSKSCEEEIGISPEKPNEKELARIVGYLTRQGFKIRYLVHFARRKRHNAENSIKLNCCICTMKTK